MPGGLENGFTADETGGGSGNGTSFEEKPSVTADFVLRDAASGGGEGRHEEAPASVIAASKSTSSQEGGDYGDHRAAPDHQPSTSVGFGNGNSAEKYEALRATAAHHRKRQAGQEGSLESNDWRPLEDSWRQPWMAIPGGDCDSCVESVNEELPSEGGDPSRMGSRVPVARATSPAILSHGPSSGETSRQGSMEAAFLAKLIGETPRSVSKTDKKRRDEYPSTLRGHKLKFGLQSLMHQKTPVILKADREFPTEHAEDRAAMTPSPTGSVGSNCATTRHSGMEAPRKTTMARSASTMFNVKKLAVDENAEQYEESDDRILFVYIAAFLLCFLTLTDLVMFLTWHLTQYKTDYVCAVPVDPSQPPAPNSSVIVIGSLLIAGNILHLLNVWAGQTAYNSELETHRWGLVHSLHKAYNFAASSGSFVWSITVLFASVVTFLVHITSCPRRVTTTCTDVQTTSKILLDVGGIARYHLLFHALRAITLISYCLKLRTRLRKDLQVAVSMNKRRYIDRKLNFDLDLTYICDRVIAMAVPCVGGAVHRNEISEVSRFFATNHYGRFLVFNLCEPFEEVGNGNYDNSLLYNQIVKLPFRDHHAPTLHVMMQFVKQASLWLDLSPSHVLAVHCKGGKGRTGTLISALLLWVYFRRNDRAALDYFAKRRTGKVGTSFIMQGVAAPSQIRYVRYMARLQEMPDLDYLSPPSTVIKQVIMRTLPNQQLSALNVQMVIEVGGGRGPMSVVYDHCVRTGEIARIKKSDSPESDSFEFDVGNLCVAGDVIVRFFHFPDRGFESLGFDRVLDFSHDVFRTTVSPDGQSCMCMGLRGKLLCFASFNTTFIFGDIVFEKSEVDHVYGKSDKVVLPEFELEVVHEFLESQTGQDDDKSEDQDHSRSQSVVSKADSQGRVAQGAGLPAQVDAATLGSNLVKSVRGTQQGTSSSSTDLGILHALSSPHGCINGKPRLTIEIPSFRTRDSDEGVDEGSGFVSRGSVESADRMLKLQGGPASTDPSSRYTVARKGCSQSPHGLPAGGMLNKTRSKISQFFGFGKKSFSFPTKSQWATSEGNEAQPFHKIYHRAVKATFDFVANKLPPENHVVKKFKKGEVIFKVGQEKSRKRIAMITKGSAIWRERGGEVWQIYTIDTMSRRGWAVEKGGLIGIYEFFNGWHPRTDKLLELVAENDVKVTFIDLGPADGHPPPLMLPGASMRESMEFWTLVAKQSCDKIRVEDDLIRISTRLRSVKYQPFVDGDCAGDVSQTVRMVQYARSHFKIVSNEQFITTALCTRFIIVPTTLQKIPIPGRIFIFANCMVWHGVDAGQGEDRRWDVCFLLHKILSVKGKGSELELVIDTNVLEDLSADGASQASPFGQSESPKSQSMVITPLGASPASVPVTSYESVSDLEDEAPNQELHGFTSDDTPRPKTWMLWSHILEMAKSIAALGHGISTDDRLHAADKNGHGQERYGFTKVFDQMTSLMYNGHKSKNRQKSFLFDSTQQTHTNLDLYNKGPVRVVFSFRTIASCVETTAKLQARAAKTMARLADGSTNIKDFCNDYQYGSSWDTGRAHSSPFIRGHGFLPENFGYVMPGEKLGDASLISEFFQAARRVKYEKGSVIFSEQSRPSLKMYHLISGSVHELNEVGDIVNKHSPGSICGMKHLMANGNVVHAFSLYASTKVEMLEIDITCSHDTFHNNLKKDPESAARFYRAVALSVFRKYKPELQRHLAEAGTQDISHVLANKPKSPIGRLRRKSFQSLKGGSFSWGSFKTNSPFASAAYPSRV